MNRLPRWLRRWEAGLLVLFALELAVFGLLSPSFLRLDNLLYSTSDFMHISIVALPLTIVLVSGGIDISFASVIGLASITTGLLFVAGFNIWIAAVAGILAGALAGLVNGLLIVITRVQPLVITLATLYMYGGLAVVLSGLSGASGYEGIAGFPQSFMNLANTIVLGIPLPFLIYVVFACVFGLFLHRTRLGRFFYLLGMNERAASYTAVPIRRVTLVAYTLVGFMAGVAGILLSSYFSSARSDLGSSALLPAITVVVLGGASIYGGSGTILGTVLASLLIGFMQEGLQSAGVSSLVSSTLSGALLIVVIAVRHGTTIIQRALQRASAMRLHQGGGTHSHRQ